MTEKIPDEIQNLLADFIQQINTEKPDLLSGFYLYGSIAIGAFNPQKSDVDFMALLTRKCTLDDLQILENAHKYISQKYPKNQLDGSYLPAYHLGKYTDNLESYPYFDGEFHRAGHYDINHITWWTLKHQGITIYGETLNTETIHVDWQMLLEAMHLNLNSYWQDWAINPDKQKLLIHDGAIEWVVLGVLRQYYSFKENGITSKTGAGEYALLHLPERWHTLIKDALLIRNNQKSLYADKVKRQEITVDFLHLVITECNIIFNDKFKKI